LLYGNAKVRHLARNTKGQGGVSRLKQIDTGRQRRQVNQQLLAITNNPELWEDDTVVTGRLPDDWLSSDRLHIMPLIRWSTAVTATLPAENRLSYALARLPRRVGWVDPRGYLSWRDELNPETSARHEADRRDTEAYHRRRTLHYQELKEQLLAVLVSGGHSQFNRLATRTTKVVVTRNHLDQPVTVRSGPPLVRPLQGLHDLAAMTETLFGLLEKHRSSPKHYDHNYPDLKVLIAFIERF
jgi:hypothetical protein